MTDQQINEMAVMSARNAIEAGSQLSFDILFDAYLNTYRVMYGQAA